MKILIMTDTLIQGGFQKVAVMEAKTFKEMGHEATLLVLKRTDREGYSDLVEKYGLEVVYLSDLLPSFLRKVDFKFPFFSFFSFFHLFYPLLISRYFNSSRYDLIISHGTYTAFSSIVLKKKFGTALISFVHDSVSYVMKQKYSGKFLGKVSFLILPLAKMLDRFIIRNSDGVAAFPEMVKEMKKVLPNYYSYIPLYNGVEVLREEPNYERDSYFISVTKWDAGKNFPFLLDVWEALNEKPQLKIVGSFYPESLENEYRSLIKKKGLESCVEVVGRVSEGDLYGIYEKARCLVHPCKEAFGMTVMEAASTGCPSVFSSNSGAADLFSGDIREMFPAEDDKDAYVNAVNKFQCMDKEQYTKYVNKYFETAAENSWDKHCSKLLSLLKVPQNV